MKKIYLIPIIIVGLFILLVLTGMLIKENPGNKKSEKDIQENAVKPNIGFSISPESYSPKDFTNFLEIASENGKFITWAGDWRELRKENSAAKNLISLSKKYNFTPIIITSLPEQSEEEEYLNTISNFVEENKISYLGLGNEMNTNYLESYSDSFSKTYEEIKRVSPKTQVFTIFQLEYLKRDSQWNLISNFEKADIIAFTTYPIILYPTPSEIPENYYLEIAKKTSKPIAFTEVGWPRKNNEQIEFIDIFNAQTKSLNPKFLIWPFLYDQNTKIPFNTMGILEKNQSTNPVLKEWNK